MGRIDPPPPKERASSALLGKGPGMDARERAQGEGSIYSLHRQPGDRMRWAFELSPAVLSL